MTVDPSALTKALSSQIEKRAMREGLSAWLAEMARRGSLRRIATKEDLEAFLAQAPGAMLRVVLKDSLRSESGVPSGLTKTNFALSQGTSSIGYGDVALYQLVGTDLLASG